MQAFSRKVSLDPPKHDCAEISVFGPGIGESIVLHYGNNNWFIIDSCLNPETKKPIVLEYLEALGVHTDNVKGILITHWHADHTGGAFELVRACQQSKIYMPTSLTREQAMNLARLYIKNPFAGDNKQIKEFASIIDHLIKSGDRTRLKTVHARINFFSDNTLNARLIALSPSDAAVLQSITQLQDFLPEEGKERRRLVMPSDPNYNAVALHFNFGNFSALLGADLETTANELIGWSAVLNDNLHVELDLSKSNFFKVPHHGSVTGHHQGVWADLLHRHPISVTTAFSVSQLPRNTDVERVVSLSSMFGITRVRKPGNGVVRDKVVEKELRSIVKSISPIYLSMGHIQLRVPHGGEATIAGNDHCAYYSNAANESFAAV